MGISIYPPDPYGLRVVFGGVNITDEWKAAGGGLPGNWDFWCTKIDDNYWRYNTPAYFVFVLRSMNSYSVAGMTKGVLGWSAFFQGGYYAGEQWTCENQWQNGEDYNHGSAAVFAAEPIILVPTNSLQSTAELLNIPVVTGTKCEIFTVDGDSAVLRIADKRDHTCIKIKVSG